MGLHRGMLALVVAVAAAGCTQTSDAGDGSPPTTPAPLLTTATTADDLRGSPDPDVEPVTVEPGTGSTTAPSTSAPVAAAETPPASAAATTEVATTTTTVPPTTTTLPDPPPPNAAFDGVQLRLEPFAELAAPTAFAWRDDDPAVYVSTQDGIVHRVTPEGITVAGDFTGQTFELLPGSERGLLGLAFDPRDGRLFVDLTDLNDDTRVFSFEVRDGVIVPETRREVLFIEQPGVGHNGGHLVFDSAGNLYIGSGDGGASNGRDAQDRSKLLGAILRVRPNLDGDGYEIPPDNPFADGVADRPEVWARGFRNPWSFSIDDETGNMWIGDVGNVEREEINVIRPGEQGGNYGWYYFEGTKQRYSDVPEAMVPPIYDYGRSNGVAVMGGFVYRGDAFPQLRGAYLFADLGGAVWAIGADGVTRLAIDPVSGIVGWGEDRDGELYLLSIYEGVHKIVP
jgi:glucose/arabinose dehydrogenase